MEGLHQNRAGQKVFPDASRMSVSNSSAINANATTPMPIMNQQAMLAQQNREMAAYDRRQQQQQQQQRDRVTGINPRNEDEDSAG